MICCPCSRFINFSVALFLKRKIETRLCQTFWSLWQLSCWQTGVFKQGCTPSNKMEPDILDLLNARLSHGKYWYCQLPNQMLKQFKMRIQEVFFENGSCSYWLVQISGIVIISITVVQKRSLISLHAEEIKKKANIEYKFERCSASTFHRFPSKSVACMNKAILGQRISRMYNKILSKQSLGVTRQFQRF